MDLGDLSSVQVDGLRFQFKRFQKLFDLKVDHDDAHCMAAIISSGWNFDGMVNPKPKCPSACIFHHNGRGFLVVYRTGFESPNDNGFTMANWDSKRFAAYMIKRIAKNKKSEIMAILSDVCLLAGGNTGILNSDMVKLFWTPPPANN